MCKRGLRTVRSKKSRLWALKRPFGPYDPKLSNSVQIRDLCAEAIPMVKKGLFRRSRDASPSNRRRGRGERGASMVEFALIAPVFFAVVFGGIEIGLMFRSYLALEDLSRSSARVASIQRDSPDADEAILTRLSLIHI